MVLLAVGIALSVWADPTALTISNGSVTVTSNSASTLDFPISRSGDTSYDAFVQYQTQDGTEVATADNASTLEFAPKSPGAYRIEAYRSGKLWILSNPVYVR